MPAISFFAHRRRRAPSASGSRPRDGGSFLFRSTVCCGRHRTSFARRLCEPGAGGEIRVRGVSPVEGKTMVAHPRALVRAALERVVRTDLLILVAVVTALGGAWIFLGIADEVVEGSTTRFDEWAVRSLRRRAEP